MTSFGSASARKGPVSTVSKGIAQSATREIAHIATEPGNAGTGSFSSHVNALCAKELVHASYAKATANAAIATAPPVVRDASIAICQDGQAFLTQQALATRHNKVMNASRI